MPRKKSNIHYLYKTICLITGRYYIGIHSTNNLEDDYMGSGKRLRRSVRKYGVENHKKEILEFFENRELLVEREKKIITPEILRDKNCMNIQPGGGGGFSTEQQKINSHKSQLKQKYLKENDTEWVKKKSKKISDSLQLQYKNGERGKKYFFDWSGKTHSDNTKRKIGEINRLKQKGENNSQFGSCWITNGIENKKIKKDSNIPQGWYVGRKIK